VVLAIESPPRGDAHERETAASALAMGSPHASTIVELPRHRWTGGGCTSNIACPVSAA